MIIRVNDISDRVRNQRGVEQIEEHPDLLALQEDGFCTFLSPLLLDFSSFREFDHIRVEGVVETDVMLECSRCLTPYSTHLRSQFTIFYSKAAGAAVMDEEVELGEMELVSATYTGDEIDLSREVAEHMIVELPLKPLCRGECKGLCSSCGADLNNTTCGCENNRSSLAFSALKNFKPDR